MIYEDHTIYQNVNEIDTLLLLWMTTPDLLGYIWWNIKWSLSDTPKVLSHDGYSIWNQIKIKQFRSDNAKELAFIYFFHSNRVIHQFSCVERPGQNSIIDIKHQHLLNVARALLFQSNIPNIYWFECISCATFLTNRIPSKTLKQDTPYEKLYHKQPDYYRFRTFGCLAFASTLLSNRKNSYQG